MRHSTGLNFIIKYLRENEFTFKTASTHESETKGGLFAEKNQGQKNLVILSL
jgi:hypothetical protein